MHCTRNGHVHIDCAHHKPNLAHHIYIYINRKGNRKPTFCKPVAQSEKESTGPTASTSKTQSLATSNVRLTHVVKHEMSEVCMKWNTQKPTVCSVIQEHSHIKCKQARQMKALNTTKPIHGSSSYFRQCLRCMEALSNHWQFPLHRNNTPPISRTAH